MQAIGFEDREQHKGRQQGGAVAQLAWVAARTREQIESQGRKEVKVGARQDAE